MKALLGRKTCPVEEQRCAKADSLRREARAALGAPAGEHFAAGGGGHTGAETVSALAVQVAGLKSSFHTGLPLAQKSRELYARRAIRVNTPRWAPTDE